MGTSTDNLRIIAMLCNQGHLTRPARIACLGAEQLRGATPSELVEIGGQFGVDLSASAADLARHNSFTGDVLAALGFEFVAFDIVDAPFVRQFDLNADRVPWRHRNSFDLVLNFGTTEHVMNQYNAMKVLHDLAKPGGLIYSFFIRGAAMDHGLLHYSDRFVDLWMRANDYAQIWRSDQNNECTWIVVRKLLAARNFRAIVDAQEGEEFLKVRGVSV